MYTAKALLITSALVMTSCATAPKPTTPQERYRALLIVAHTPKPDCLQRDTASGIPYEVTDSKCVSDRYHWSAAVTDAVNQLADAEIAAAPACIANWKFSPQGMEMVQVDPTDPHAVAKSIIRGYVNPAYFGTPCLKEVCAWQRMGKHESPFCSEAYDRADGAPSVPVSS
jgi:hypothetical protein